ncbi:zinc finger protein 93-like [Chironomus tepperi]|uniref:zinc finger protein 93-like n=1 Tax=Chironomus tepperi TaxID=113505 RepID=UPI00391F5DA6
MKEPIVKIEPIEYEVLSQEYIKEVEQNMLYIKSERDASEPEEEFHFSEDEEPKPKRIKLSKETVKATKSLEFKCEVCSSTFDTKKEISEHVYSSHACDQEMLRSNEIFYQFDKLTKPTECDICRELFNDKELLLDHFKAHFDNDRIYPCPFCDKSCKGINMLGFHKNLDHKKGNFYCLCHRTFDDEYEMKKCRKSHKSTLESQYWCDDCPSYIGFDSLLLLARHKTNVHGNGTKFWCVVCGKIHPSEQDSIGCKNSHQTYHRCDIKCPECGKKVKYYTYKSHFSSIHSTKRDLICEQCGKGFTTISALHSHIKLIHEKTTYKCDICGYTCLVKFNMKKHLNLTHNSTYIKNSRDEAFKCPICLKIYSTNLDQHMEKYHPNNYDSGARVNPETNKYHCPKCIQAFMSLHHYEKHVNGGVCSNFEKYEVEDHKKLTTATLGK